jgi:hypothetical protein
MAITKKGDPVEVAVFCTDEGVEVGHLPFVPPGRTKLTASLFWARFVPIDDSHRSSPRVSTRDGGYAHCPRCRGKLALRGALRTAGKPDLRDALVPIILGTTIVEVSA